MKNPFKSWKRRPTPTGPPRHRKSLTYLAGLLLTAVGLITLLVFVIYEGVHARNLAEHVVGIVVAALGGSSLVILGFSLMVAGSPGIDADELSVPREMDTT